MDRTHPVLEEAARRARKEKLDIEFLLEDIRSFVRPVNFDLALSLFTSFGYFENSEDNQQVLENSFKSLRDGGSLVLEMMGKEVGPESFKREIGIKLAIRTFYKSAR